ncbi:MAG: chromate transporter [Thermoflexus sp.]|nr:chromate transporter [Thermoflexus sp.]
MGIFLPSFVLVALTSPWIPRLRRSRTLAAFLDGVNSASLRLMAGVVIQLALTSLADPLTVGIGALSLFVLFRFPVERHLPNTRWAGRKASFNPHRARPQAARCKRYSPGSGLRHSPGSPPRSAPRGLR